MGMSHAYTFRVTPNCSKLPELPTDIIQIMKQCFHTATMTMYVTDIVNLYINPAEEFVFFPGQYTLTHRHDPCRSFFVRLNIPVKYRSIYSNQFNLDFIVISVPVHTWMHVLFIFATAHWQ